MISPWGVEISRKTLKNGKPIKRKSRIQSGLRPREDNQGLSKNNLLLSMTPTATQIKPVKLQTRIVDDGFKKLRDSLESACSVESAHHFNL